MAEPLNDAELVAVRKLISSTPFDWNKVAEWAMRLIQTIALAYVAHLGWNADTKAEQAAVNSSHAVGLVNEGIEIGRANHAAIRETQEAVKKVNPKKGP